MVGLILITGSPGVGKSTVLLKTVELLRRRGHTVGGMVTTEARDGGRRIGFRVVNLRTGQEGWLARTDSDQGVRFGRYRINATDLENVGVAAVLQALSDEEVSVLAIDEVGPMELTNQRFRQVIERCKRTMKAVIATVHHSSRDSLLRELREAPGARVVTVTLANREKLPEKLLEMVEEQRHTVNLS